MAPAAMASPPNSHLVRLFISLFAKRIEPRADGWQATERTFRIKRRKAGPFGRNGILGEYRFHRTLRDARIAIDASLRIDHEHVVIEVKGIDGANEGTVSIATVDARFGNDICH